MSARILNILAQPVVVPIFEGTAAGQASRGQPVSNVTLGCGSYQMYWDGKIPGSGGREAPSGVYAVQIIVDGKLTDSKKIYYAK